MNEEKEKKPELSMDDILDNSTSQNFKSPGDAVKMLEKTSLKRLLFLTENARDEIFNSLKKNYDDELKKIEKNSNEIKKELEEKIEKSKIKIVETLGIFTALFTFISVEFQAFKIYQSPQAIGGLTLLFLGSILTFITIFDFVLNNKVGIKFIALWAIFISVGGFLFVISQEENFNNKIYKIENQGATIQIQGNEIAVPKEIKIQGQNNNKTQ